LNPGAIGVSLNNDQLLEKASELGFDAIVLNSGELATWDEAKIAAYKGLMHENRLSAGASGLPIEFRDTQERFQEDIERVAQLLPKVQELGVSRMSTWIMPCHDELPYESNMEQHAVRLKKVAALLKEYRIRLGLEYVGPKTLKESKKYPFVSNMKEVKELIERIGESNVGIQLDAFHWYCAGESREDLLSLSADDVVTVDLNDAKFGRTRDQQLDWERELPSDSGVIDLKTFLAALQEIGYVGPLRAEPFNRELNNMDDQEALKKTKQSLDATMSLIE
jgi:sugar phosphate isomerase/epimerase